MSAYLFNLKQCFASFAVDGGTRSCKVSPSTRRLAMYHWLTAKARHVKRATNTPLNRKRKYSTWALSCQQRPLNIPLFAQRICFYQIAIFWWDKPSIVSDNPSKR